MRKKKQFVIQNARFMKPTVSSEFKSGSKYQQENKPPVVTKHHVEKKNNKIAKLTKKNLEIDIPILTQIDSAYEKSSHESEKAISDRTLTPKSLPENEQIKTNGHHNQERDTGNEMISENEIELKSSLSDLNVNLTGINSREIEQAQETCKQLRNQILQLKRQQKDFLKQSLPKEMDSNKEQDDQNSTVNAIKSTNTSYRSIRYKPLRALLKSPIPETETMPPSATASKETIENTTPNFQPKSSESNISFAESASSLDTSIKSECLKPHKNGHSSKLIKKLYSEKLKYKNEVQELKNTISKYEKNASHMRMPDIPAHHIAYYNADLIGEGRMSLVYSGTIYETKQAAIKKLVRPDTFSSSDRSYLVAEAGLLMSLHHQNIVEVYGVSSSPLQPLLIMQLVNGVTLQDKIHSSSQLNGLNIAEYYSVSRDVCIGMAYLHSQKPPVLHLNLRPCNIFIDNNGRAKVADFGFSKIRLDTGASNRASVPYLAPELLHFPVHLTTKLDVFSYSIILWEMATRTVPFHQHSLSQILEFITEGKRLSIPASLPSGYHSLITQCWNQSPLQRPTFKEIIVVIETMILPSDWKQEIKKQGIKKFDIEGLYGGENERKKYTPMSVIPAYQPTETTDKDKDNRQRVSDHMTLEHDMKTLGYQMPLQNFQGENLRGRSNAYNNIEKSMRKHDQYRQNHHMTSSPVLAPRASPVKISINEMSRVYGIENPNVPDMHPNNETNMHNIPEEQLQNFYDDAPFHSDAHHEGYLSARMTESANKFNDSEHSTNGDKISPLPLTNRDLRFIDQDLNVETPKIIYQAKPKNYAQTESAASIQSENDIRAAMSVPSINVKHPSKTSSRSEFDEKMKSYLSDACESESRIVPNVRVPDIGWRSSRSNILHRKPPTVASSSDRIKVMSIGTSEADRCFKYPHHRSDTCTESVAESRLTTAFKPTYEQRQRLLDEINQSNRLLAEQEGISTTLSMTSFTEDRQIAVLSHPSNTDMSTKSHHADVSSSSSESSPSTVKNQPTSKQSSDRRKTQKRRNSKLERSYTPEQQLSSVKSSSSHSLVKNQYSNSWNPVPLPPKLSDNENRTVQRSFSNGSLASRSSSNIMKNSSNRRMKPNNKRDLMNGKTRNPEVTTSSTSFQSNDSIAVELAETANELNDISTILTVAKQRNNKN